MYPNNNHAYGWQGYNAPPQTSNNSQTNYSFPPAFPTAPAPTAKSNDITFKIRHFQDVRRITLASSTSFSGLQDQITTLFGDKDIFTSHSIKYKDDEGDWVTMSSDLELKEATRGLSSDPTKRLIQLSVEPKNAAVQQVSEALHQMQKDPNLLKSLIQSLANSQISMQNSQASNLSPPAQSSSWFTPPQQNNPWNPNPQSISNPTTPLKAEDKSNNVPSVGMNPVVLPQTEARKSSQVWCDSCGVKLLLQSHKCDVCPDYDLCDSCFSKRNQTPDLHVHSSFTTRKIDWGNVEASPASPAPSINPSANPAPTTLPTIVSPPTFLPTFPIVPSVSAPVVNNNPQQPASPFQNKGVEATYPQPPMMNTTPVKPAQPKTKHNAICDECKRQIEGVRWKCTGCDDFDVCEECYPKRTHNNAHSFFPIHSSEPIPSLVATITSPSTPVSHNAEPPKASSPWGSLPPIASSEPSSLPPQELNPAPLANSSNPGSPQVGLDRKTIEDGLRQLNDMGFKDRHKNLAALVKSQGNVVSAIASLL